MKVEGHIKGGGLTKVIKKASLWKCEQDCMARIDCNAFQHSRTQNKCTLLSEKIPNMKSENNVHDYGDYIWCSKKGNIQNLLINFDI